LQKLILQVLPFQQKASLSFGGDFYSSLLSWAAVYHDNEIAQALSTLLACNWLLAYQHQQGAAMGIGDRKMSSQLRA